MHARERRRHAADDGVRKRNEPHGALPRVRRSRAPRAFMRAPKKKEVQKSCAYRRHPRQSQGSVGDHRLGQVHLRELRGEQQVLRRDGRAVLRGGRQQLLERRFFLFSAMRARASATISSSVYPASGEKPFALRISDAADMVLRRWCVGVR